MMKKKLRNIIDNKNNFLEANYTKIIIAVLLFSAILRFWNIQNRWSLGDDGARDVSIAHEALRRHELPLIGSFSSAGPFVFGPLFYWFIMVCYFLVPWLLSSPFYFLTLIGIANVLVLAYIGKRLSGPLLGIVMAILSATSPQLVVRSLMLGQHSFIAICSSLLILFFVLLWQTQKLRYAFLMGIFLGIGLSMHYEMLNMGIFFLALFAVPKLSLKVKLLSFVYMFLGFLIPSLPLMLWDAHQNFANLNNILDYFLIAQYRLYVPNSWKLFLFGFLPQFSSFIIGRFSFISFPLLILSGIFFIKELVQKTLDRLLIVLGIIFGILLFVNRYYKGERSESYLVYFIPFVILFFSWVLIRITTLFTRSTRSQNIGSIALTVLIGIINISMLFYLHVYNNSPIVDQKKIVNNLINRYPNKQFSVYDYNWRTAYLSQPISALLGSRDKIATNGIPVGVCQFCPKDGGKLIRMYQGESIVSLQRVPNLQIRKKSNWVNVNPSSMYNDLIVYWRHHKLTSTFSLKEYILEKLHIKKQ